MEIAIKLDSTSTVPLERLAKHYIVTRRPREAIALLRRVLRRDPTHVQARFLLAGLAGEQAKAQGDRPVPSPPAELIADLFDAYAPKFEEHLVKELRYSVPDALAALVAETGAAPDGSWRVVDLGCGTGLAGSAFRRYARTLIGSDLSPRMISRARERNVYDALHLEDLVATLAREHDLDLVVAADVFIYVGALEATFAACAAALHAGGLLVFSVERSAMEDVVLEATLRYAHSDAYIQRLASTHGFAIVRAHETTLRIEDTRPEVGVLYILQR
jgi:predicted TPR repeat methyltransferase